MSSGVTSERGFDRLVNFSDAVVAIAISLLILPVVDAVTDISDETGVEFFTENGSRLIAFVVSFVVIAKFWLVHHSLFEKVVSYTQPILIANFVWLISIVFIPLPTEMLGETRSGRPVRPVRLLRLAVREQRLDRLRRLAHPAQPGDVEGPVRPTARLRAWADDERDVPPGHRHRRDGAAHRALGLDARVAR